MLIQCLITIILVTIVCMVDFSVFFLNKDTEKLLYYDESEVDAEPVSEEGVDDVGQTVDESASSNTDSDFGEEFVDDFEKVPSEDIDVAALARDLVQGVQEDAKRNE